MTPQAIFNKVVKHLRKQGKRAGVGEAEDFQCLYRAPDGTKCAVGCLLKDDEYSPIMESKSVDCIQLPERLYPHSSLLVELQDLHDGSSNWKKRGGIKETAIRKVAKSLGLKVPE